MNKIGIMLPEMFTRLLRPSRQMPNTVLKEATTAYYHVVYN